MRHMMIKAPPNNGKQILEMAGQRGGKNMVKLEANDLQDKWDVVFLTLDNRAAGRFMKDLEEISDVHITFFPQDALTMLPPQSEVADQITDVLPRSPMEIWLKGLQSIGSWKGFFGYAVSAAIVVWIGMFTNTVYLLVAAMILAPFAGPAMNIAIATATGDSKLLWRNLLRYFTALSLTVLIALALSLILNQDVASSTMVNVSKVSSIAVLLPLVAGVAGALTLVQAESNSLVSGTAVGLLVAASLAPPAALIGMSSAMGRWDMVVNGAFILLLQLVGINLGGTLIFRAYGLKSEGQRYERGRPVIFYISLGLSMLILIGLLIWQFSISPDLQRSTQEQRAASEVQLVLENYPRAQLVQSELRFTRPQIGDQNTLLGIIYVQRNPGVNETAEEIRQELTRMVQNRLLSEGYNVTPLIDVVVLDPPSQ
jgi:uncharacterized hydrophobic protein (TIGR00271 family)